MMASFGLRVSSEGPAVADLPENVGPPAPEPPAPARPIDDRDAIPVTMTKRKATVKGIYHPASDALTVLAGAKIDLAAVVWSKDKLGLSTRDGSSCLKVFG
jgi:hypothetical protein